MARRLKDEIIEGCWNDVKVARKDFKAKLQDVMERNLAFYYGKQWDSSEKETGLRHITVNYGAANLEIKWSSLTFKPPTFSVAPFDKTDPLTPIKLAEYLNRRFVDSGAWDASQAALYDALLYGTGVVLTGWNSGVVRPVPVSDPELEKRNAVEDDMEEAGDYFASMGAPEAAPQVLEEQVEIVGEGPKAIHVPIEDLIIDPRVKWHNWREARFIGRVYVKGVEELKRNKALKNTDKLQGQATLANTENALLGDTANRDLPEDALKPYVMVVEMWYRNLYLPNGYTDDRGRRYSAGSYPMRIVWAENAPETPLLVEMWPYEYVNALGEWQYPFDFILNRINPKSFYGISDMTISEPQQMELNRSRSQEMTRGEQLGNVKYFVSKNNLTPSERAKLESQQNGIVIVGNGDQPPVPIMKPGMDGDISSNGINARTDMNVISGVDDQMRGVPSPTRQTATEVQIAAEKSAPRGAKAQEKWERFLSEIGDKIIQVAIMMDHTGDVVPVSVPKQLQTPEMQGDVEHLEIEEDDLVLSKVEVQTGSTRQLDKNEQLNGAMQLLQLSASLGVLGAADNPKMEVNTRYVLGRVVELSDFGDLEQVFDVSAYQQQLQQAQQQMMEQQQAQEAQEAEVAQGLLGSAGGGGGAPEEGIQPQDPSALLQQALGGQQ